MTKRIATHTLGCKTNQYDTQAMLEQFLGAGYEQVAFDQIADVYLINTCSVTAMADKKSRQFIRKASMSNDSAILVCGCLAQRDAAAILELGADIVIGTSRRGEALKLVEKHFSEGISTVSNVDNTHYEELVVNSFDATRALLKIQEGCDNLCTYCVIAPLRGNARSRGISEIRNETERLVSEGYNEVVLTGTNLASFGKDTGYSIQDAIIAVLDSDISRVRLGSLDPGLFTDDFIEFLARNKRICRHFHISLQSGCDDTLKLMGRKYTTEQYRHEVSLVRSKMPNAAITTDIMVGFAGEDERRFNESLDFARQIRFAKVHVFPFSIRPGTPAEKLTGHISKKEKSIRAHIMQKTADESRKKYLQSMIGEKVSVLIEEKVSVGVYEGYSGEYIRVKISDKENNIGNIADVILDEDNIVFD